MEICQLCKINYEWLNCDLCERDFCLKCEGGEKRYKGHTFDFCKECFRKPVTKAQLDTIYKYNIYLGLFEE